MNGIDIDEAARDPALRLGVLKGVVAYVGTLATTREAAQALGVSPGTLRRWRKLGRIQAVHVGGGVFRYMPELKGAKP